MTAKATRSASVHTRLSSMLLRWILLLALAVGLAMSLVQVAGCVLATKKQIRNDGQQLLAIFSGTARQALQNNDAALAGQMAGGLLQHPALRFARLGRPDELPLAEQLRPLQYSASRYLTDRLFSAEQYFYLELDADGQYLGRLEVSLDTAGHAARFLREAGIILLAGLLGAAILIVSMSLVLRRQLSRPLSGMLDEMTHIDPERPGRYQLSIAPSHQHNELGQWVERVNQLWKRRNWKKC